MFATVRLRVHSNINSAQINGVITTSTLCRRVCLAVWLARVSLNPDIMDVVDGRSSFSGVLEVEECDLDELKGLDGAASSVKL